jgi:hypothetical protein
LLWPRIVSAYERRNKGNLTDPHTGIETHFLADGGFGAVAANNGGAYVEFVDTLLD